MPNGHGCHGCSRWLAPDGGGPDRASRQVGGDGAGGAGLGLAYAAAIPTARFQLLDETGHSPQLETPDQVIHAIWDSANTDFSAFAR